MPTDCYLVTLDVNSLYTNIDNEMGIQAVEDFLKENTQFHDDLRLFCRTLLTFILTKNFFLFEDEFFIQRNGTAMGSNVAPPYANIYMAEFESRFVYVHPLFQQYCRLWKRYIDDIFLIWCGDIDSLLSFHQSINQSVNKLTFTIQYDSRSIPFLDTLVIINEDGVLSTDLYVKPTDKNSLLLYTSCHPRHIKKALPKSQFQRINRIVSNNSQRSLRLNDMASKFRSRGYPDSLLDFHSNNTPPTAIRSSRQRIAFVNTHHPFMQLFYKIIYKHWPLLGLSYPKIPEFLAPPLICHKKPPNLRNLLVSADVGSAKTTIKQTFLTTAPFGMIYINHTMAATHHTVFILRLYPGIPHSPFLSDSSAQQLAPSTSTRIGEPSTDTNKLSTAVAKRQLAVLKLISLGDTNHTAEQLWNAIKQQSDQWFGPLNLQSESQHHQLVLDNVLATGSFYCKKNQTKNNRKKKNRSQRKKNERKKKNQNQRKKNNRKQNNRKKKNRNKRKKNQRKKTNRNQRKKNNRKKKNRNKRKKNQRKKKRNKNQYKRKKTQRKKNQRKKKMKQRFRKWKNQKHQYPKHQNLKNQIP
ncbi:unnamed protein product [Ranitomeya imitator]|uniref:Reverse transcriptase domain-containing protein n=1 Tax=Ranitomeya imitator TaxID=111125 RepID=A0ABN9LG28_9NEOB|nr:unnamed protein product [Ranitomeya imitator]